MIDDELDKTPMPIENNLVNLDVEYCENIYSYVENIIHDQPDIAEENKKMRFM